MEFADTLFMKLSIDNFMLCLKAVNGCSSYFLTISGKLVNTLSKTLHTILLIIIIMQGTHQMLQLYTCLYRYNIFEGRSRASYGLTRPGFVHHFSPRKPAL